MPLSSLFAYFTYIFYIHEFRSVGVGWLHHQSREQCIVMQSNDNETIKDFHFLAFLKDIYESPCAAIESIRLSIGQPEQSQTGKRL